MTKTETALILARQYAEVEREYHIDMDEYNSKRDEMDKNERTWWRGKTRSIHNQMSTIRESAKLLGINDKQWYTAITTAYIENSNKEQGIA